MTRDDLAGLFAYSEWATARLFDAAAALDADAWARDLGGSLPTLGGTLAHVVGSEWLWLRRWQEDEPTAAPTWTAAPTPDGLRAALAEVERDRAQFLARLTDADLDRPLTYTLFSGAVQTLPLREVLLQVVFHSMYHRGQIASKLRELGTAPPATDYLVYAVHQSRQQGD